MQLQLNCTGAHNQPHLLQRLDCYPRMLPIIKTKAPCHRVSLCPGVTAIDYFLKPSKCEFHVLSDSYIYLFQSSVLYVKNNYYLSVLVL